MSILVDRERAREVIAAAVAITKAKTERRGRLSWFSAAAFAAAVNPRFQIPPHIELLDQALSRIASGDLRRLVVLMPPRHGKSGLCSHYFPAWYLLSNPERRVILASYEADFAASWGRKARDEVEEHGPAVEVNVRGDSSAASRWDTSQGGGMITAGVMGPIAGRGANCFPGYTLITTNQGLVPIRDLCLCPASVKILSYDIESGEFQWKAAQAFSKREASGLYRITTATGRVVEATGDHLFWMGSDYKAACHLTPGDSLLCLLQPAVHSGSIRDEKVAPPGHGESLLFAALRGEGLFPQVSQGRMSHLHYSDQSGVGLLQTMPSTPARAESRSSSAGQGLPDLRPLIPREVAGATGRQVCDLLRQVLCGAGPFAPHGGQGQPQMEEWGYPASGAVSFCQGVPPDETTDPRSRLPCLPCVRRDRTPTRPPSRQLVDEQRGIKLSDAVRGLSSGAPPRAGIQPAQDTVALVERVQEAAVVYDLQVVDNHNFFANGFLVHNCLIIDDPVKNAEEAKSSTYRRRAWDWYQSTAYPRLEPDGAIILVMTHWHQDDLAGRILAGQTEEEWEIISLPALAEPDDPLGRSPGAPLWPERYPEEKLREIRGAVGQFWWSALYQQRPAPREGGLFKWDSINENRVEHKPFEVIQVDGHEEERLLLKRVVVTVDPAGSHSDEGSETGITVAGRGYDGDFYVWYSKGHRLSPQGWAGQAVRLYHDNQADRIIAERNFGGEMVEATIRQVDSHVSLKTIVASRGKELRAEPVAALYEQGKVHHVGRLPDLEDQLCSFPQAELKDLVDSVVYAVTELMDVGTLNIRWLE